MTTRNWLNTSGHRTRIFTRSLRYLLSRHLRQGRLSPFDLKKDCHELFKIHTYRTNIPIPIGGPDFLEVAFQWPPGLGSSISNKITLGVAKRCLYITKRWHEGINVQWSSWLIYCFRVEYLRKYILKRRKSKKLTQKFEFDYAPPLNSCYQTLVRSKQKQVIVAPLFKASYCD